MSDSLTSPRLAGPRPRAGRPTREQAVQRVEQMLDRALEMFLESGFELTTVEAIAASVGMTKRTVYARFKDKRELFRAAVLRAIDRWSVPLETLRALESESLEETLVAFTRVRMESALSPTGIRLSQITNAEAYRFPEIRRWAYEHGTLPALRFLADLLRRHAPGGSLDVRCSEELALAYITLASGPARSASLGDSFDRERLEERIELYVTLFLNGVWGCTPSPAEPS
ncbi:TetR/AcrR family transcriptional regulator [Novosphingobium sp. M1R2S20]|uniref:TetR/AcrR family transcriptional regulator n=1 Tax=Novosphingobium rhizovicinum TaxID=3228928 RepID=A0ABV3RDR0_9SPHN